MAFRYDTNKIKFDSTLTPEGFIQTDGVVTRVGVFRYDHPDGSTTYEARHWKDVWESDSIATMRMLPVVDTHRGGMVTPENIKQRKVGHVGENILPDGSLVIAPIRIDSADGIKAVENGRDQLSLGYACDVIEESGDIDGVAYDHRQINIRYNHLAIVDSARAGEDAKLRLDSLDAIQSSETKRDAMKKIRLDQLAEKAGIKRKYDAAEYEVDAYVSLMIEDLMIRFDESDAARKAAEGKVDGLTTDLVTANRRADSLQGKLDTATEGETEDEKKASKDKMDAAVKERVRIITAATPHVDEATRLKFDGMSDREIMATTAKILAPKFDDTGKSDDYVLSRFDSLIEAKLDSTVGGQREQMGNRGTSTEVRADAKPIEQLKVERKAKMDAMPSEWRKEKLSQRTGR